MTEPSSSEPITAPRAKPELVGIALSGGGVRSASFAFGVLQYLSRFVAPWTLRRGPKLVLSTVSGGGWAGATVVFALRRLLADRADPPSSGEPAAPADESSLGQRVAEALSHARARVRRNASYLTATEGKGGLTRGTRFGALVASYVAGLLVNLLELTGITSILGCALVALLYVNQTPTDVLELARCTKFFAPEAACRDLEDAQRDPEGDGVVLASEREDESIYRVALRPVSVDQTLVVYRETPYRFRRPALKCIGDACYIGHSAIRRALEAAGAPDTEHMTTNDIEIFACAEGNDVTPRCRRLLGSPEIPPARWYARVQSVDLYMLGPAAGLLLLLLAASWDRRRQATQYGDLWLAIAAIIVAAPGVLCRLTFNVGTFDGPAIRFVGALLGAAVAALFVLLGARVRSLDRHAEPKFVWMVRGGRLVAAVVCIGLAWMAYANVLFPWANIVGTLAAAWHQPHTFGLTATSSAFIAFWVSFALMSLWALVPWAVGGLSPDAEAREKGRAATVILVSCVALWLVMVIATTPLVYLSGDHVFSTLLSGRMPATAAGTAFVVLLCVALAVAGLASATQPTPGARLSTAMLSFVGILTFAILLDLQSWALGELAIAMETYRHGPVLERPSRLATMDAAVVGIVLGALAVLLASMVRKVLTRGLLTPHYIYRDRIRQVFMNEERCTMEQLGTAPHAFEWVINAVANVPGGARRYELGTEGSGCEPEPDPDDVTPTPTGKPWRPARHDVANVAVDKALAVSAAAISPLMGVYGDRWIWWLASLLNLRLGARLPAAGHVGNEAEEPPHKRIPLLPVPVSAVPGQVYVTDGGHLDNSGLDALLRRRCRVIVVVDGEQDGPGTYGGLSQAVRLARLDGIDVDIDLSETTPGADGFAISPCAVGTVTYPEGTRGVVVYIRPTVSALQPVEVRNYRLRNPTFPHQSTSNQFFDEEQFDAYRQLGLWSADRTFRPVLGVWDEAKGELCTSPPSALLERGLVPVFEDLHRAWRIGKATSVGTFIDLTDGWTTRLASGALPAPAVEVLEMPDDPEVVRAELLKIQHMSQVFEATRLWQTASSPDNAGWLQLFFRYWGSADFRKVWEAYVPYYSQDLRHFATAVLRYIPERAAHTVTSSTASGPRSKATKAAG